MVAKRFFGYRIYVLALGLAYDWVSVLRWVEQQLNFTYTLEVEGNLYTCSYICHFACPSAVSVVGQYFMIVV